MRFLLILLLLVGTAFGQSDPDDCVAIGAFRPHDGGEFTLCMRGPDTDRFDFFGVVVSVYDGDTFTMQDGVRVRVWGIQAPEIGDDGAIDARDWLASHLVREPIMCLLPPYPPYNSGNRVVRQCFVGGQDIADLLVDAGHAVDVPRFSGGRYAR